MWDEELRSEQAPCSTPQDYRVFRATLTVKYGNIEIQLSRAIQVSGLWTL